MKYIYIKEKAVLLDVKTAYISPIFNDGKNDIKEDVKIKTLFGSKIEQKTTKAYYFNYGDSMNKSIRGGTDRGELLKEWQEIADKIVETQNKERPRSAGYASSGAIVATSIDK